MTCNMSSGTLNPTLSHWCLTHEIGLDIPKMHPHTKHGHGFTKLDQECTQTAVTECINTPHALLTETKKTLPLISGNVVAGIMSDWRDIYYCESLPLTEQSCHMLHFAIQI